MNTDILIYVGVSLASLIIIMESAGYIILALTDYAKKTGVSDYLIGFIIVSLGTSLPEITTAFVASFSHASTLALGNVIGANIIDVTLLLGLVAILGRKIEIHGRILNETFFTVLVLSILPFIFGLDGMISNTEGLFLIISFFVYLYRLLKKEGHFGKIKKDIKLEEIWQDMAITAGSIVALLLSANWLIFSSKQIGLYFEIPYFVMGLLLMAFGTTVPELSVEIKSILHGKSNIAFGNIIGSVVVNSTLVIGIAAIIRPIEYQVGHFMISSLFMVTSVYIAMIFLQKKEITWQEGLGLILLYVTFLVSEIYPKIY